MSETNAKDNRIIGNEDPKNGTSETDIGRKKGSYEEILAAGNSVRFCPRGWSMYPLIREGDSVIVEPIGDARIKRGDILLYRRYQAFGDGSNAGRCNILVLHRVHHVDNKGIYFVGDNQKLIEGPIETGAAFGRLSAVERRSGKRDNSNSSVKVINVRNIDYRILSGVWLVLRPVRPVVSRFVHFVRVKVFRR